MWSESACVDDYKNNTMTQLDVMQHISLIFRFFSHASQHMRHETDCFSYPYNKKSATILSNMQ